MSNFRTEDSLWRVKLAEELSESYKNHPEVRFIIITGSVANGNADKYSDLDIIVFWEKVDFEWLEYIPLSHTMGERRLFRKDIENDSVLECYYFGSMKVDFGHLSIKQWTIETDRVITQYQTDPDTQKSMFSFLSAISIYGQDEYLNQYNRLKDYPEPLAIKQVRSHLGSFSEGCLELQGLARGETLFVYDALCKMMTDQLEILAGLNRIYSPFAEPRHIKEILHLLKIKPDNFEERFLRLLDNDLETGLKMFKELKGEILELVGKHFPEINIEKIKWFRENMKVEACPIKPMIVKGDKDERP